MHSPFPNVPPLRTKGLLALSWNLQEQFRAMILQNCSAQRSLRLNNLDPGPTMRETGIAGMQPCSLFITEVPKISSYGYCFNRIRLMRLSIISVVYPVSVTKSSYNFCSGSRLLYGLHTCKWARNNPNLCRSRHLTNLPSFNPCTAR
jgi:hypothetical protein